MITDLSKHPGILYASETAQMAERLKAYGITYFCYTVLDTRTHHFTGLCNHEAWTRRCFEQKYHEQDISHPLAITQLDRQTVFYLYENYLHDNPNVINLLRDAREHGIANLFCISKKSKNHTNCYFFGTDITTNVMTQFYLNHVQILLAYIQYFKDTLRRDKTIYSALQKHIQKSHTVIRPNLKLLSKNNIAQDLSTISNTPLQRYYLDPLYPTHYLTVQEFRCVQHMHQGLTSKQIAFATQRSVRTIEEQIKHIKEKLHCQTLYQLGAQLAKTHIGVFLDQKTKEAGCAAAHTRDNLYAGTR